MYQIKLRSIFVLVMLAGVAYLINWTLATAGSKSEMWQVILGTLGWWLIYLRVTYHYQLTDEPQAKRPPFLLEAIDYASVIMQLYAGLLLVTGDQMAINSGSEIGSLAYIIWVAASLAGLPGLVRINRHRVPKDIVVKINGQVHRYPDIVYLWPVFHYEIKNWQFNLN